MEISKVEQSVNCYEFYVIDKAGSIAFMYSAGGELPKSTASSKENLDEIWLFFENLKCNVKSEVLLSNDSRINEALHQRLYVFDNIDYMDSDSNLYKKVGIVQSPLDIEELPNEIKAILSKTVYNGYFDNEEYILITNIT
jgi:hypothetical protein